MREGERGDHSLPNAFTVLPGSQRIRRSMYWKDPPPDYHGMETAQILSMRNGVREKDLCNQCLRRQEELLWVLRTECEGVLRTALGSPHGTLANHKTREMNQDHTMENLFLAPLSLLSTLAVILLGARGDSASQMEKVLHLKDFVMTSNSSNTKCAQDTGVHAGISALLSEIKASHSRFHMVSGMFTGEAHPFLPKYLDCIEHLYNLKPEHLDFKNNLEKSRMYINSWIEKKTKGEIKDILAPSSLASSDQLVLVSSFSFRGISKDAFQKEQTKVMAFRLNEYKSKPVQMMQLCGRFKLGFIEEPRAQVLELPNAQDDLKIIIILPSEDLGVGQITREISYENLKNWASAGNMKGIARVLHMPQLRLEERHEDLSFILEALGMTDIFDSAKADLSGITSAGGLMVSKIIHKVELDFTAGNSEFECTNQTSPAEAPEIIKVDHPFLFLILHKQTETILFYGRVASPEGKD
ncbi:ovalbumin-like [Sorex fumeus]|uniref:ovalbumin-like n=1 Tax=Sorex fumeus TaxID=62283 RepID=UPI0024AE0C2E|nr:ovalbumin-like [Sorex fumeus]